MTIPSIKRLKNPVNIVYFSHSRFMNYLKYDDSRMEQTEPNKTEEYSPTILAVDDNKINLQLIGFILKERGYKIAFANDGPSALRLAENINPDLILLDIMMPVMDGFEVCDILKSEHKTRNIPVIFLTARTKTEDIVEGFQHGGVDFISKPFRKEEFLIRIKTHIDLKRSHDTIASQSKELKAINTFKDKTFSIIAHDLMNAVGSFKKVAEIFNDPRIELSVEDQKEFTELLKDKADETYELLENILYWSRCQRKILSPKLEQINLHEVAGIAIERDAVIFSKKDVSVINEIPESLYAIADREMVKNVFKQLISNAVKFSHSGNSVILNGEENNEFSILSVIDHGTGIKEEDMPKLFDQYAFFSTFGTNQEKGSGLGLNLCYNFLELNGGSIHAKSVPGQGSKFTFSLKKNI